MTFLSGIPRREERWVPQSQGAALAFTQHTGPGAGQPSIPAAHVQGIEAVVQVCLTD